MKPATATEAVICRTLGQALPTRSRQDTIETRDEIQGLYATFQLTCPAYEHLVPGVK